MSWIKDNKFLVTLGGTTLVAAILLTIVAFKGISRYDLARQDFETSLNDAASYETGPLYPKAENRDGKQKAIDEYRKSVESLQAAFEPYRSKELKNISPPEFSNLLKASSEEVVKSFDAASITHPPGFFCGFDEYKNKPVDGGVTGLLGLQLASIKSLMLDLSAAGITEIKNIHRPALPEEKGQKPTATPADVARALPLEITFLAREKAVRQFVSALTSPKNHYAVIRSIRVLNTKKAPPRASDAKLDAAPAADAAPAPATSGFVFPGDATPSASTSPAATPAAPAPGAADASSSTRIAGQVLGTEELYVFIRLDFMLFQPAKPLP